MQDVFRYRTEYPLSLARETFVNFALEMLVVLFTVRILPTQSTGCWSEHRRKIFIVQPSQLCPNYLPSSRIGRTSLQEPVEKGSAARMLLEVAFIIACSGCGDGGNLGHDGQLLIYHHATITQQGKLALNSPSPPVSTGIC